MGIESTAICPACGLSKPKSDFTQNKTGFAYGKCSYCKKHPTSFHDLKNTGLWLGVDIGEELFAKRYPKAIRMSLKNRGYDFICNGFKIDVKTACLNKQGGWNFTTNYNQIADYFYCIGIDNRDDLNVLKIYLFPSTLGGGQSTISATYSERTNAWSYKYENAAVLQQII